MLLDILIPTYNRIEPLKKNLFLLIEYIINLKIQSRVSILISNNCSTDSTKTELINIKNNININLEIFNQNTNIGLEKNAVFILGKAKAKYVMFLGDDDFLQFNYLKEVVENLSTSKFSCIIPSFFAKRRNGQIVGHRSIGKNSFFLKGFASALKLSMLGHQLSGVTFLREGTLEKYLDDENFRNIYLFIAFVGFNCLRGDVLHLTEYPVDVTVGEKKDWNYGEDALFNEKIKNVLIISKNFPNKFLLENKFYVDNIYSIYTIYPDFKSRLTALYLASSSKNLSVLFKIYIPFLLILFISKKVIDKVFKSIGIK